MLATLEWNGCFAYFITKHPYDNTYCRSLVIFRTHFEQFSWRSKEPVGQAVSGILYTVPGYSLQQQTLLQYFSLSHNSVQLFLATEYRSLTLLAIGSCTGLFLCFLHLFSNFIQLVSVLFTPVQHCTF